MRDRHLHGSPASKIVNAQGGYDVPMKHFIAKLQDKFDVVDEISHLLSGQFKKGPLLTHDEDTGDSSISAVYLSKLKQYALVKNLVVRVSCQSTKVVDVVLLKSLNE